MRVGQTQLHEAYLRLAGSAHIDVRDRGHFLGLVSRVMRHVLVDHARARKAARRGSGAVPVDLNDDIWIDADSVRARPQDASRRVALGLALAGLGRKQEAVGEVRHALELVSLARMNPGATAFMGVAIEVFGRAGELDAAFELVELLLSMPAGREVTIPFLRVWPGFDPLRDDSRFEPLLERFSTHDRPTTVDSTLP